MNIEVNDNYRFKYDIDTQHITSNQLADNLKDRGFEITSTASAKPLMAKADSRLWQEFFYALSDRFAAPRHNLLAAMKDEVVQILI